MLLFSSFRRNHNLGSVKSLALVLLNRCACIVTVERLTLGTVASLMSLMSQSESLRGLGLRRLMAQLSSPPPGHLRQTRHSVTGGCVSGVTGREVTRHVRAATGTLPGNTQGHRRRAKCRRDAVTLPAGVGWHGRASQSTAARTGPPPSATDQTQPITAQPEAHLSCRRPIAGTGSLINCDVSQSGAAPAVARLSSAACATAGVGADEPGGEGEGVRARAARRQADVSRTAAGRQPKHTLSWPQSVGS